MLKFWSGHLKRDYEYGLTEEVACRRNYWKLEAARYKDNFQTKESIEDKRPLTVFINPNLSQEKLKTFMEQSNASTENVNFSLRKLEGIPSEYDREYLSRNGRPTLKCELVVVGYAIRDSSKDELK